MELPPQGAFLVPLQSSYFARCRGFATFLNKLQNLCYPRKKGPPKVVSKASKVHILKGKRWWFSREFQREALSTVRNRVPSGSTLWPSDRLWGNSSITFHGNKSSLLYGETIGTSKSRPKPAECSDLKAGKFTHKKINFGNHNFFTNKSYIWSG